VCASITNKIKEGGRKKKALEVNGTEAETDDMSSRAGAGLKGGDPLQRTPPIGGEKKSGGRVFLLDRISLRIRK